MYLYNTFRNTYEIKKKNPPWIQIRFLEFDEFKVLYLQVVK